MLAKKPIVEDEPEKITPLTVLRDTACHGARGVIGKEVAQAAIANLEAAGFTIVVPNTEPKKGYRYD